MLTRWKSVAPSSFASSLARVVLYTTTSAPIWRANLIAVTKSTDAVGAEPHSRCDRLLQGAVDLSAGALHGSGISIDMPSGMRWMNLSLPI